jgi:hypothetical protein
MRGLGTAFIVSICCGSLHAQWEADKRLTVYPSYADYGSSNNSWTIAVQDTMVHIVWEHRDGANPGELYYIRSINSGSSFDPDKQLTTSDSHYPSVAVRDSIVHIVWMDARNGSAEIYYKRSVDNGKSWEADEKLTNNPAVSKNPSVAVRDSIVHIVWMDARNGDSEIYYKRSVDNGETWEADERLTDDPATSERPSVAVRDSIVHVVWYDGRDGNGEIYCKRSVDNGENWDMDERLTNDPATSERPSVAVRDSIVHVAWMDRRDGNDEIYYSRSVDNGMNWDIDERLTNDPADSWCPSIAVCDSIVHVVWFDERDGNDEIYYSRSVDNGKTWGIDERLTNDPADSWCLSVACWNCDYDYDVHVVWTDMRDGNEEIYYKRHKCEPSGIEDSNERKAKSPESRVVSFSELGGVRFSIYLSRSSLVELEVFDVSGRSVDERELAFSEGKHDFNWHNSKSGLYFFRFKIDGSETLVEKAIVF